MGWCVNNQQKQLKQSTNQNNLTKIFWEKKMERKKASFVELSSPNVLKCKLRQLGVLNLGMGISLKKNYMKKKL